MANPDIVAYINDNRARFFTDEAIRAGLSGAGYEAAAIDEAFAAAAPVGERPGDWGVTLGRSDFWFTYIAALGGVIFLFMVLGPSLSMIAGGVPLLPLGLLVVLIVGSRWGRFNRDVHRGFGCALVTIVVVPLVLIAGLWAYCLVAQPRLY
ncbi:MAG: hypothetical protein HY263_05070 [Chloroflexi bacterium]|nr:hypothetical protein [Chloroflexota bacterium]